MHRGCPPPPPRWMHVLCARLLPASAYHHDNKLVCTQSYVTCIPLQLRPLCTPVDLLLVWEARHVYGL